MSGVRARPVHAFQEIHRRTSREKPGIRIAPKGANIRYFTDEDAAALYVRYREDARIKIRQQRFSIERQPVRTRDAKGPVLTANPIEYVGAEKASDWNDDLTGPPGRFIES